MEVYKHAHISIPAQVQQKLSCTLRHLYFKTLCTLSTYWYTRAVHGEIANCLLIIQSLSKPAFQKDRSFLEPLFVELKIAGEHCGCFVFHKTVVSHYEGLQGCKSQLAPRLMVESCMLSFQSISPLAALFSFIFSRTHRLGIAQIQCGTCSPFK